MAQESILIVDDEPSIRMALKAAFTREGMVPSMASCGTEALNLIHKNQYDLIVLDIMLQDLDGYEILRRIREEGNFTPVLMLSGRQTEIDQVLGLGLGADDYLTKPFHVTVLIHKVKALIRRKQIYDNASKSDEIILGPFRFDLIRLECYKNGELIPFTAKELAMFRFFMEHPHQVFSKEQLYAQVWNENVVDDNTIMVYIKRLRQKIGDSPKNPVYLRTIRGIGYVFYEE